MRIHQKDVSPFFGPVFAKLVIKFRDFLQPHVLQKLNDAEGVGLSEGEQDSGDPPTQRRTLVELKDQAIDHYKVILDMFDHSIEEYRKYKNTIAATLTAPRPPVTPKKSTPNQTPRASVSNSTSRVSLKRGSNSDSHDDNTSKSKKSKKHLHVPNNPSSLSNTLEHED